MTFTNSGDLTPSNECSRVCDMALAAEKLGNIRVAYSDIYYLWHSRLVAYAKFLIWAQRRISRILSKKDAIVELYME
jgi:hypothetical protein